jgi:hypothetical protein
MERLGRFAEQTTPTFTDLGVAAPGIDRVFENLGPFSKASQGFFKSFGENARRSSAALRAVEPLLPIVKDFGKQAKPFAANFSELLAGPKGLRSTGGLERLLDFIYLGAGSVNGYDALGHFLRAEAFASTCLTYSIEVNPTCSTGKFRGGATASKTSVASTSAVMARTLAVLKGMTPAEAIAKYPGGEGTSWSSTAAPTSAAAQPVGGAASGTTYYTPEEGSQASGLLLNYLLGD